MFVCLRGSRERHRQVLRNQIWGRNGPFSAKFGVETTILGLIVKLCAHLRDKQHLPGQVQICDARRCNAMRPACAICFKPTSEVRFKMLGLCATCPANAIPTTPRDEGPEAHGKAWPSGVLGHT